MIQITDLSQIARGDCLELLREIPAGSVDMVLTDLPYGNTEAPWDIRIDEAARQPRLPMAVPESPAVPL